MDEASGASDRAERNRAPLHVAIIGAGATGTYALSALLQQDVPCAITVFEAGAHGGPGIPYSRQHNGPDMLANIAGIEIPPLRDSINDWAVRQDRDRLDRWGIADIAGNDRAFFPRVVIGAWLAEQFAQMSAHPPAQHSVTLRMRAHVTDIIAQPDAVTIEWQGPDGTPHQQRFDRVVLSTGYGPTTQGPVLAGSLARSTLGARVAVLGSSLSAIDAVITLAGKHGRFVRVGGQLEYRSDARWHTTMLSRQGLLPAADFWFPVPVQPCGGFTAALVRRLARGRDGDLDAIFARFRAELGRADPDWAAQVDLAGATVETFAARYFADRLGKDPFVAARVGLAEAERSFARQAPPRWRHAILQMHDPFGEAVPHLSAADMARFDAGLRRCFADCYAAVPHLSIERLLACHASGHLAVRALGQERAIRQTGDGRWAIAVDGADAVFDTVIDARGHAAVGLDQMAFPTLRMQLCARANALGDDWADGLRPEPGGRLDLRDPALGRIHALTLPLLLRRQPFVQGLVECARLAGAAAGTLALVRDCPQVGIADLIERIEHSRLIRRGDGVVLELPSDGAGAARSATANSPQPRIRQDADRDRENG